MDSVYTPPDPHARPWMMFVDGENFVIRGQEYAKSKGISLIQGKWYQPDIFLWFPDLAGTFALTNTKEVPIRVQPQAIRSFYYTTVTGDDGKIFEVNRSLHDIGFSPRVFKKESRSRKTKGVDISLSVDLLSNAYNDNFEVAVLIAGDADYIPLVDEVKRMGKVVYLGFFVDGENGMSPHLDLRSDRTFEIGQFFQDRWQKRAPDKKAE